MSPTLTISDREWKEIHHALYYYFHLNHGTVGHNMLVLIAKLALDTGFTLKDGRLYAPDNVIVES